MQPLLKVSGTCAPLRRSNVDTDQILPAAYLQRTTRNGFAEGLFARWRAEEPSFCLNDIRYDGARVLLTGPDFGTGSSREHAVWALQQWGFAAVISSRFGDIFRHNCANSGLLAAQADRRVVEELMDQVEAEPTLLVHLDLERVTLAVEGQEVAPFHIPTEHRRSLLSGVDPIAETLSSYDAIRDYEATRSQLKPTLGSASSVWNAP